MRYTLRLLTLQRSTRGGAHLRLRDIFWREDPASGGGAVPDRPVGGPAQHANWTDQSDEIVKRIRQRWRGGVGGIGTPPS